MPGASYTGAVLLVAAEELPRGLSRMMMPPDGLAYGAVRCRPTDSDEPDREAPDATRVGARAGGAAMHCACVKKSGQRGESTPWPHAASVPSMSWPYHQVHGRILGSKAMRALYWTRRCEHNFTSSPQIAIGRYWAPLWKCSYISECGAESSVHMSCYI